MSKKVASIALLVVIISTLVLPSAALASVVSFTGDRALSTTSDWDRFSPGGTCSVAIYSTDWGTANVTVQHRFLGSSIVRNSEIANLVNVVADVQETANCPRADYRLLFNSGTPTVDIEFVIEHS